MSQLRYPSVARLIATVLLSFATYAVSGAATKASMSINAPDYAAIASSADSMALPVNSATGRDAIAIALTAQKSGLLSPQQTAQLTRLPILIVIPTELPIGFRLVRAEGEAGSYANGDDDSGYAIDYQGLNNTCLSIRSSQDGPRGLETISQVQTRFGLVTVYAETFAGRRRLISFLGLKGNPILISGGTLPDRTAKGGWRQCRAVSVETYTQVLKSLVVVK